MKELNKLTQRLLNEGYTKDNPPDFVREWNDFYGGWEYTFRYHKNLVFKTGCGLLVRGDHWSSGVMYYMGVTWSLENGNPVITCPYFKSTCEKNHPLLKDCRATYYLQCCCEETTEPYIYDYSLKKVLDEQEEEKQQLFEKFKEEKHGRICQASCHYNFITKSWEQSYEPVRICSKMKCYYCSIFGRKLSKKKGNVFYDVKETRTDTAEGLLNQGDIVTVTKGKRFLDKNVSIDICNIIVKKCAAEIERKHKSKHFAEIYFSKHHGRKYEYEIFNIRAEARESRDLEQDLEDIKNGITAVHQSDLDKDKEAAKKERVQKNLKARVKKYKKMLAETGFNHLDNTNQIRIRKMVEKGYISEDEINREPIKKPEQLSLF